MDPNATTTSAPTAANTGYPVLQSHRQQQTQHQQQHYGQQFPFHPGAFPQTKTLSQQHSFGAVPFSQPGGPGGAIMPAAGGFPQHSSAGPHANFTAPFVQPPVPSSMNHFLPPQVSSSTPNPPSTVAQTFSQNMASMSANNMISAQQQRPFQQQPQQPLPQQQPQHPQQPQQPQQQTQQAQPQPQPQQQQQQQQSAAPFQGTPQQTATQSGPAAAREKARVAVLLELNSMLLQEVVNLQVAGKAGAPPQQQGSQESNPSPGSDQGASPAQKPSPEYIECMRRLQANLAYLATIADRAKKSGGVPPPAPAIMTPPPNMPSMVEVYNKLNELFPRPNKGGIGTPQPSPQGLPGNGKPSPSPAAESVV